MVVEATTVRQYHTKYAAHLLGRVTPIYAEEVEYYTNLDLFPLVFRSTAFTPEEPRR